METKNYVGHTKIEVGTKVELKNIKGKDNVLNGMTGTITHPFAFGSQEKNWVGIWLDDKSGFYGENCNVRVSECKMLSD